MQASKYCLSKTAICTGKSAFQVATFFVFGQFAAPKETVRTAQQCIRQTYEVVHNANVDG